ncbi:MAG: heme-binding protein [Bryobacteraceae bacterium]
MKQTLAIFLLGILPSFAQNANRPQTQAPQLIDTATAKKIIAAAEAAALKANAKVGISVVDANGDLVASLRIDGASSQGVNSSQGKARAALLFGLPTKQVQDYIAAGKPVPANVTVPPRGAYEFIINQGGVPILKDGKVIGAVGVGGAASSDDERFAQAGVEATFGK